MPWFTPATTMPQGAMGLKFGDSRKAAPECLLSSLAALLRQVWSMRERGWPNLQCLQWWSFLMCIVSYTTTKRPQDEQGLMLYFWPPARRWIRTIQPTRAVWRSMPQTMCYADVRSRIKFRPDVAVPTSGRRAVASKTVCASTQTTKDKKQQQHGQPLYKMWLPTNFSRDQGTVQIQRWDCTWKVWSVCNEM